MAVGFLRVLELFIVEWRQGGVLFWSRRVGFDGAPVFFKATKNEVKVIAGHVEITTSGAGITLVLVVATTEARRSTENAAPVENVLAKAAGATNGVARTGREWIAVDYGAVDSQETTKVKAHSVDFVRGLDNGLHVCDSIMRQVSVIGESIQTRTRTSLITGLGRTEGMQTTDADELLLGIECSSSFLLLREWASFRCSFSVLAICIELFRTELWKGKG